MNLLNNDPSTDWFGYHNRLARFRKASTGIDYWQQHWEREDKRSELDDRVTGGSLGEYAGIFNKYLDKNKKGLILEAGCGTGYLVELLRNRGFRITGVDYEEKVIEYARKKYPEANVEVGDINHLRFSDGSVTTYISLGVLEHFEEGCEKALKEAYRILAKDGTALISVPYLNPSRKRFLEKEAKQVSDNSPFRFYQYYFEKKDFADQLEAQGFEIVDIYPLFPFHFLQREHPGFRKLWRHYLMRQSIKNWIKKNADHLPNRLLKPYAHMLMYICKKRTIL